MVAVVVFLPSFRNQEAWNEGREFRFPVSRGHASLIYKEMFTILKSRSGHCSSIMVDVLSTSCLTSFGNLEAGNRKHSRTAEDRPDILLNLEPRTVSRSGLRKSIGYLSGTRNYLIYPQLAWTENGLLDLAETLARRKPNAH